MNLHFLGYFRIDLNKVRSYRPTETDGKYCIELDLGGPFLTLAYFETAEIRDAHLKELDEIFN